MRIAVRVSVLVLTLLLVFLLYSYYYNINGSILEESLGHLFDADIVINEQKSIPINDNYINGGYTLKYSFDKNHNHYEGSAVLEKGFNQKYRIVRYNHVKDTSIISVNIYERDSKSYLQINGMIEDVSELVFFNGNQSFIVDVTHYKLLDEIELKIDNIQYYTVKTNSETSHYGLIEDEETYIFKGDTLLIYFACGLIVVFGFMTFSMFSKETNLLEGIFKKLTKSKSVKNI